MDLRELWLWEYQTGPIHVVLRHVLFLIALFSGLTWIMSRFLFRPLLAMMEQRGERVRAGERAEQESRREQEEQTLRYRESLQAARREAAVLSDERLREAERGREGRLAEARATVAARLAEARDRVRAQEEEGRAALEKDAAALARSVADRVLGRPRRSA